MDVFQFLEKREIKIDDVFSRKALGDNGKDLFHSFKKLGYVLEKKWKTWWDITSFEQYIGAKLIPRGLRWDIPANNGLMDEESVQEWSNFFTHKVIELLELLLARKQRNMKILESQIKELRSNLEPLKESDEFQKLSADLQHYTYQ